MYLRPSKICFSQDSIGSTFGRCTSHRYRPIGETLDDILRGNINVNSIPNISVFNKDGKWFTADNRRLWVFQEAEKRGKCSEIYVRETSYIDYNKITTMNDGESVTVRGDPGGYLWQRMPTRRVQPDENTKSMSFQTISTSSYTNKKHIEEVSATGVYSTNLEQSVQTCNEIAITKRDESLFIEQNSSRDVNIMYVNRGIIHSADIDSDSEENIVDENSRDVSFASVASNQQDIANVLGPQYGTAKPNVNDTAKEEKVGDEGELKTNKETVVNPSNISGIPVNVAFLNSNSETLERLETREVVVTMCDESNAKSSKCPESKRCIVICFILTLIALLSIILGITLA